MEAAQLGFLSCGIADAVPLHDDARRLEAWLAKGYHADMAYMANHFDLRIDPTKLVPGAKSVVTLLCNYFPSQAQQVGVPKIAKYAFGNDYHEVIRGKLNSLLDMFRAVAGAIEGRGFVDSAPVLERAWALRSGLGWIGKNGNLIHPKSGSFFFIATLIIDFQLDADPPFATDHCGTCRRCIDACPTDAIVSPKEIDANRCISYFTIELKSALMPEGFSNRDDGWVFGCDVCQDVCPWNRFSKPHNEPAFAPIPEILTSGREEWLKMTEESFKKTFRNSPLKRAKWTGILRNISALNGETTS